MSTDLVATSVVLELERLDLPRVEVAVWVLEAVAANPGIWTARLCRSLNGLSDDDVARCGLCAEYANLRKRRRAAALPPAVLPGFEVVGGAYQLRRACPGLGLTALRKLLYRLRDVGLVEMKRERIPDGRQARGWDWGTRLYLKEEK